MPTSPRMPRRCRGISLPPSKPSVLTPPSQREAGSSAPAGAGDGFPRQSADWLGMTGQEQGTGTVNGCRGRCPHRPETYDARDFGRRCVGAGFYPARFFTIPPSRLRRATSLAEGGRGEAAPAERSIGVRLCDGGAMWASPPTKSQGGRR